MSQDEPKLGDLIGITNSDLPIFFIIDTRINITLYKFEIKNNQFDYFLLKNFVNKFIKEVKNLMKNIFIKNQFLN